MSKQSLVTLLKSGNRLLIDPTPADVRGPLEQALTYTSKQFFYGKDRFIHGKRMEVTDVGIYTDDHRGRLVTAFGFYDRVLTVLDRYGYVTRRHDISPHPHPEIFVPDWDRLFASGMELRAGQAEMLVTIAARLSLGLYGRIDCAPGFGKSSGYSMLALAFPRACIHVAAKRVPVLRDRIFPEMCQYISNVGMVCGGKRDKGHRVMLYSFDSLHHSDFKADILLVEELQEASADTAAEKLARYDASLNFGFSATHDMRLDGKDLRAEAMCGPIIYKVGYQDAQEMGLVVPIEVHWSRVMMDTDPCGDTDDPVEKKRWGVWRNEHRNRIVASNARKDADVGLQQMITCETLEHALSLKRLLPDFELVYSGQGTTYNDVQYFKRHELWPEGETVITPTRRDQLTRDFERGVLRKAIVTTVWNVGVSFNYLDVVNRADAGGSPIMDTQIPGRVSRISPDGAKTVGRVRDYRDLFNAGFKLKSGKRHTDYVANGWKQFGFESQSRANVTLLD